MSWTTITQTDVEKLFAEVEYQALVSEAIDQGITDFLETTIANAVNTVRGYIAGCSTNTLNTGETVPGNLKSKTLDLIRFEMLNRLGMDVSDDRLESYRSAIRLLEQAASCKFAVDTADDPESGTTQNSGGTTVVASRDRIATRRRTDGLF